MYHVYVYTKLEQYAAVCAGTSITILNVSVNGWRAKHLALFIVLGSSLMIF